MPPPRRALDDCCAPRAPKLRARDRFLPPFGGALAVSRKDSPQQPVSLLAALKSSFQEEVDKCDARTAEFELEAHGSP